MTQLDIMVLTGVAISTGFGIMRGSVSLLLLLLSWFAAFFVARCYYDLASGYLARIIENPAIRHAVAFIGLFALVLMVGKFASFVISKFISFTGLRALDLILGAALGLLFGLVTASTLLYVSDLLFTTSKEQWWQQSILIPVALEIIEELKVYFIDVDNINIIS